MTGDYPRAGGMPGVLPHNAGMLDGKPSNTGHDAIADATGHAQWMLRGTQLHAAGQPEHALLAFEKALLLAPDDVNAASACATMLTLLDRPRAAYQTLLAFEAPLMQDADGAANLAIAAETCGDIGKAHEAYNRALELMPEHVRAMTNVALLAAAGAQWDIAIGLATKCLAAQPLHPPHHVNLSDFLLGAGQLLEALDVAAKGAARFPAHADLKARHIALLAITGAFEASDALITPLDRSARLPLAGFLGRLATSGQPHAAHSIPPDPDQLNAFQFYLTHTLQRLQVCDWQKNGDIAQFMKAGLDGPVPGGAAFDYGLTLELTEREQAHRESTAAVYRETKAALPPLTARRKTGLRKDDSRIHVGFTLENPSDPAETRRLKHQLALHDAAGFAIHVYLTNGQPGPQETDALRTHAASVVQISHMSDVEIAGRIRLDQLDIHVQLDGGAAWCRPAVAALRVAPVQLRQPGWQRYPLAGVFDYVVSDNFVHPDGPDTETFGAVVRLPQTCWLAAHHAGRPAEHDTAASGRRAAGLPSDALVLCSSTSAKALDPQTFALWMKILRSLPDAILWLPACQPAAAANLVREAETSGVNAGRLLFSRADAWAMAYGDVKHADLFLDNLRVNTAYGLEDALRAGVPAITCAGDSMASRLGGSMLHAAGLPECVLADPAAYAATAIRLGRDADALAALRVRVQAACAGAPLFDLASRVRDRESAWTTMVERSRAGLPPAAFDVATSTDAAVLSKP